MLPLLAIRRSYNADDDNIWFPIPTPWGPLRIGIDKNEEEETYDDDNWGIGITYHSPWGKFYLGYRSNEEEAEEDDNWDISLTYHSPWGKFTIGYHNTDEEKETKPQHKYEIPPLNKYLMEKAKWERKIQEGMMKRFYDLLKKKAATTPKKNSFKFDIKSILDEVKRFDERCKAMAMLAKRWQSHTPKKNSLATDVMRFALENQKFLDAMHKFNEERMRLLKLKFKK
ncbi:hypothetical protein TVAG_167120 [Trichomonas vaginalis G3]|uniref:Uncharacterized protein n=1 Tax=Trichomonas vaginalis (strain ATCC PRA-98 / G3) TaxID=412133 RepID=A2DEB9_TRIV3|nr:hypothetical protein TVAGG3_0175540 [Trichomonas vaginalis G3]EAY21337.1 hypothetical protein TVAG_167120 [Trichomonas vaginalis G3]KAI5548926.1 hypothetical protein TVAGG3_0175540 [Trichomonas vaginalis G3]|eukprot:XP_001582323.1 hypothetical protein [Trichomonas vaginalis G3]